MKNIELSGITKLIVCILVIIATVILGLARILNNDAVVALISGSLGYVYGNGHGIMSAKRIEEEK